MIRLNCSAREAQVALAAVPHKRFQDAIAGHWRVVDGTIVSQSVCWLFCWAKNGMGSLKAAQAAQDAFDTVSEVSYSLFDARVGYEWAREHRYAESTIDDELEGLLGA